MSTVKTKISDYMKLSKEDRQKHIDLSTHCQFHYFERDWNCRGVIKKAGDLYNKVSQMTKAKNELLKELNIEDFSGREIHVCHLCDCDSGNDKVCVNPFHTYFGTFSENMLDKQFEVRQKVSKLGGKIGVKKMNEKLTKEQRSKGGKKGAFKQKAVCLHCGKEGALMNMYRWHFDNCKFKPVSETSKDTSSFIQ